METLRVPRLVPGVDEPPVTTWTAGQAEVLAHRSGSLLVLGGPGTGKTAVAAEFAADRIRRGVSPALVVALTRQAASAMRDRIVRAAGRTVRQSQVMTLHSLARAVLSRYGDPEDAVPRLLTAPEQEFRLRELLRAAGTAPGWPADLADAASTGGFARQVRAAVARARMLSLDPADLVAFGRAADEPAWVTVGRVMEEYLDVLDAEQVLDYAELVHRCRILLTRPHVAAAVHAEYGAVVVDEFAELDPAQIALVRALAFDDKPVVALADPDTAIYRFRGAHPRAAAEFLRLFGTTSPPQTVVLDEVVRAGRALLAPAARLTARLGAPAALDVGAVRRYRARWSAAGAPGTVVALSFATEDEEARQVAHRVRTAQLDGLAWTDMAVIVRSGDQAHRFARALLDADVPVEVAGDEIGLAAEPAVRALLLGLELACGSHVDGDQARRLLVSAWGELDAVAARTWARRLRPAGAGPLPVDQVLAAVLSGELPVPEDAEVIARRVEVLSRARELVAEGAPPEEVLWELWQGTPWPQRLRAAALRGDEAARQAHRDLDAVVALFTLAGQSQAGTGASGVRAFLAEVAAQQIPADVERESAVHGRGVRVLTVHRTKGRSWPFVVVAGVQEGVWPDVRRRGSILDPERLTDAGLTEGVTARDLVANERRLFLLAISRAERRLLVTAVAGVEGEANQPSRFVAELGVEVHANPVTDARITTLTGLVARLRAATQDMEASPELRAAAASRLARLADETDGAGHALVPDADPDRWWGTAERTGGPVTPGDVISISPSQLAGVLTCPRQYFLAREARAEPRRGSAAVLGRVIHALAEHALTDPDLETVRAHLDAIWDRLPFQAAWLSATERAAAEEAVERILAWQESNSAEAVGVEKGFRVTVEVDGQPITVSGTVDRLERESSGRLRVVDFKSSRSLPTQREVAEHEQLGVYQLAVEQGAFEDVAPGAPGSAGGTLVFVRHGEGFPKLMNQPSLTTKPHLGDDPEERRHPTWVHHRLAQAAATLRSGRFDAVPGEHCRWCPFESSCPARPGGQQVIA